MRVKSRAMAIASISAAALFATACGGGSDDSDGGSGGEGGTITASGCNPENPLVAGNTAETCGGDVLDVLTAKLVHYNPETAEPENDIAESIETDDNQTFTVKIKEGYKFHDGTDVTADSFVDAWNYTAHGPNAQTAAYFMQPIEGFKEVNAEKSKVKELSGLEVVDDHTFTIKTTEKVSNLKVRLGYTAFAPLPDAFLKDPTNKKWEKMPIGAGPYKVTDNTATAITVAKNGNYAGAYQGHVDKVTFKIYNDASPAYNDTVANNLDINDLIPTDQLTNDQWKNDLSGRWAIRQSGINRTLTYSGKDKQLAGNKDLVKALGMDIDRETITKQIFAGSRTPADGWVSPVVDGYKKDQCGQMCKYDKDKAVELYKKSGGYKGTLTIAVNGDGDHKAWSQAICNGWKNDLGLKCQLKVTPDFKTLRDMITKRQLQGFFRTGWQMDYPSIENFLTPMYATGASSNDNDYSNKAFDAKLADAAAATNTGEANKLYQKAEKMLVEDPPNIPLWTTSTPFAWSNKVANVKLTPFGTIDFQSVSVK